MNLPQDAFTALGTAFPTAKYDSTTGYYVVDCDVANQPGSVDFKFGGKTVKVSYSDVTWLLAAASNKCIIGAQPVSAAASEFALMKQQNGSLAWPACHGH